MVVFISSLVDLGGLESLDNAILNALMFERYMSSVKADLAIYSYVYVWYF